MSFIFNFGLVNLVSVLTGLTFSIRGSMPKSMIVYFLLKKKHKTKQIKNNRHYCDIICMSQSIHLFNYKCHTFHLQGSQTLTAEVWQAIQWKDPRLRWSPRSYFGIQSLSIPIESLWTPDIVLYNKWVFVLSVDYKPKFGDFVDRIYPIELEINDTTDTARSASCLDLHPQIDNEGWLRTKLYDKRDDLKFPIVNFPFICSNIPAASAYGVYIAQLIRYSRSCRLKYW